MPDWKQQLDRATECLTNGTPSDAFLKAFGALEVCFGAIARRLENNNGPAADDRFAQVVQVLVRHRMLIQPDQMLASHIAAARNVVTHRFGFEPSRQQVENTIKQVERLCAKFGKRAYEVMVHPVITATRKERVANFIPGIVDGGISQIPVIAGNKVVGTLTDVHVLKAWEQGDGILDPETPVEMLMSDKVLPNVKPDLSIEEVRKVMLKEKTLAVLVLNAGLPQGILTRFDLLEHVGVTP